MGFKDSLNDAVSDSPVGRYFKLEERGSKFTTELLGGLVSFLTMAYIIPVNAAILADTGGTCDSLDEDPVGFFDCRELMQKDLITATAASACIGCMLMGALANLPILLAPGMGMNAYFAYTVVGYGGTGNIAYEVALAAVFIEGIIFLVLALSGLRGALARLFPHSVREATPAGIGFFLTHIGLQAAEGIGLVTADAATLVELGACPPERRIETAPGVNNYYCDHGYMESPRTWLGIVGFGIIVVLMCKGIKGSMMVGILFVSIISWFRDTDVTYFPDNDEGNARYDYFKEVAKFEAIDNTAGALEFELDSSEVWVALITFLYVDLLDTTGTLHAIVKQAGFMGADGTFEGEKAAFSCDAIATMVGALLGTSPVTSFIESAAGIEEGARTGLTALTGGILFFVSIFFNPIFSAIPPYATGPALIVTGCLMMRNLKNIAWEDKFVAFPAFLTIVIMPLTYSIAYGLIAGICSHGILFFCHYVWEMAAGRMTFSDVKEDIQRRPAAAEETEGKDVDETAMIKDADNNPMTKDVEGAPPVEAPAATAVVADDSESKVM